MASTCLRAVTLAGIVVFAGAAIAAQPSSQHWTQWGGPTRDFMVPIDRPGQQLAGHRTEAAVDPRARRRALGDPRRERPPLHDVPAARPDGDGPPQPGRSRHRARCRDRQDDLGVPLCLADRRGGFQPRAPARTPRRSIVGNRLFAVGSRREFFALDKNTGKVLWSHDLIKDYGAPSVDRGMANSPLLYNNTILLPIGGTRPGAGRVQSRDRRAALEGRRRRVRRPRRRC